MRRFVVGLFFCLGMLAGVATLKSQTPRFRITVDTICNGWTVCVHDSDADGGVKSLTLLDDLNGEIIIGGHYKYVNVSFTPEDDPMNIKEIVYQSAPRDVCFTVQIDNLGRDAYAPIYIVSNNGYGKVAELRYSRTSREFVPPLSVGLKLQPYEHIEKKYVPSYVGEEICREYYFVNHKTSWTTYFKRVDLESPGNFRIRNVTPPVGTMIHPGDTVLILACFIGPDTMKYQNTIGIETDCFETELLLYGQAGTGLIVADDKNFGKALIGTQVCGDVTVKNTGNKPVTLDERWVMDNVSQEFDFSPYHSKNKLPITLGPKQKHNFYFCYIPRDEGTDSAQLRWSSDIPEPYKHQTKPFSNLVGTGVKTGVKWDRSWEYFPSNLVIEAVHRVYLVNVGSAETQLTRIWIDGPHESEFRILATGNNTNPPTWGGTVLAVGDTMFVDIGFLPDARILDPTTPRLAFLRTSSTLDSSTVASMSLTGGYELNLHNEPSSSTISVRPNPARDRISVEFLSPIRGPVTVSIHDILGREVSQYSSGAGQANIVLSLPHVTDGIYFVRVSAEGTVRTHPIEIRK